MVVDPLEAEARKRELGHAQEMLGSVFLAVLQTASSTPVTRPCHHSRPLAFVGIGQIVEVTTKYFRIAPAAVDSVSDSPQVCDTGASSGRCARAPRVHCFKSVIGMVCDDVAIGVHYRISRKTGANPRQCRCQFQSTPTPPSTDDASTSAAGIRRLEMGVAVIDHWAIVASWILLKLANDNDSEDWTM